MRRRLAPLLALTGGLALALGAPAFAQAGRAARAESDPAVSITPDEIQQHIEVLASDLFQGREASTLGERRAAGYIVSRLADAGRLAPAGPDGGWYQPFEVPLHGKDVEARNILAMLPGHDPRLAHEVIVVGAHYDHVGFGDSGNALDKVHEVHNGADDNASGSATLIDLATSLANSGWEPRRTILFEWFSGEELGLLGSKHYVEHPVFPIEDHVFMINMDMVGRLTGRRLLVGGTGTSPGLADLAREDCEALRLDMLDDPPGSAPSDNTSFYDHDIPSLFLFTGLHDDYHRATDDAYKINAAGAADVGRLARRLLEQVDARDARPAFRSAPGMANVFTPHAWIGASFGTAPAAPDTMARVEVVVPDSPAGSAGLEEGDLVYGVDGRAVHGPQTFDHWLDIVGYEVAPVTLDVLRAAPGTSALATAPDSAPGHQHLRFTIQPIVR